MASRCILIKQDGTVFATLTLDKGDGQRKNFVWIDGTLRFNSLRDVEQFAKQQKMAVSRKTDF